MKTITQIFLLLVLGTSIATSQIRDTLVNVGGRQVHLDYDASWSSQDFSRALAEISANQKLKSFKASPAISAILDDIPTSSEGCINGGFEDNYLGWTGLSLKHTIETLPVENGLVLSPGIAPLPFTGLGYGQNYTSIETAGLDPIISVASPPFPLQRLAPGTSGAQSLRLGNNAAGYGAEGVAKRFIVTPSNAKYYFQYSMVMDRSHSDPDGTINGSEVFFLAEATDMSGSTIDMVLDVGSPSNPFINPVNGGSTYYRDWRCAYLDLSSQVGQEVVVMFINSDCARSGHNGYSYLDDVCEPCRNINEGEINLNLDQGDCLEFPQSISGDFLLPLSGTVTDVNISLEIYQSNVLVNTVTGPTITPPNYLFTLAPTDFPDQTPGTCYDLVAVLTFNMVALDGSTVTVRQESSKEVGGVQDGEKDGINNDVCFCEEEPTNEGAYCCDDDNLVANGNFEAGNTGFSSSYTQTATTYPGEYDVTNSAAAFGAIVTDHSFCADPITYAANDLFMVVNGKTQTPNISTIWQQTLTGLEQGERYKFCANFKNMPQCTFDILPEVFLNAGGTSSGAQTINVDPANPCDWQTVDITFTATGSTQNIQILLNEGGNGDGNDVAIDDIYVGKLTDPNLQITVQHDGTTNEITGSLNTIAPGDDNLHGDCDYYWFVAESSGFPVSIIWSTFAYGNASGSMLPPFASIPGPIWDLTTTFPGYVFSSNKLYVIGMYAPECGCYSSDLTYQLTFNSLQSDGMSEQTKEEIIDAILNGLDFTLSNDDQFDKSAGLNLYPNPVKDQFAVSLIDSEISEVKVFTLTGEKLDSVSFDGVNKLETIKVSSLASGVYIIKVKDSQNRISVSKIVKE